MIRRFNMNDLKNVMEVWLNTNIQAHSFISKEYWINNYEMVKGMLPQAEVYVYEEEGSVKGFIGIDCEHIAGLFVVGDEQSKGIGKALVQVVKERYKQLSLKVYIKNTKAISFYEKQGFKKDGQDIDETTGEIEVTMIWENYI